MPELRNGSSDQLVAEWIPALERLDARYRVAFESLSLSERDRRRADGGWSAHMILEHLVISNEAYLPSVRSMAKELKALPRSNAAWKPKIGGLLLAKSLTMQFKMPAPPVIKPGPTARPEVLDAFLGTHNEIRSLMRESIGKDWRAAQMTSPFASFVRLNFGDACLIALRHGERHAGQLERLIASFRA